MTRIGSALAQLKKMLPNAEARARVLGHYIAARGLAVFDDGTPENAVAKHLVSMAGNLAKDEAAALLHAYTVLIHEPDRIQPAKTTASRAATTTATKTRAATKARSSTSLRRRRSAWAYA